MTSSQLSVAQGVTVTLSLSASGTFSSVTIDGTPVAGQTLSVQRAPKQATTYTATVSSSSGQFTCSAMVAVTPREYCIIIYKNSNYGGESRTYDELIGDDEISYAAQDSWNDHISSIKVHPGCTVKAYEHSASDPSNGWNVTYTADQPTLPDVSAGVSANDKISRFSCSCQ